LPALPQQVTCEDANTVQKCSQPTLACDGATPPGIPIAADGCDGIDLPQQLNWLSTRITHTPLSPTSIAAAPTAIADGNATGAGGAITNGVAGPLPIWPFVSAPQHDTR
jgi:hypothetical protein